MTTIRQEIHQLESQARAAMKELNEAEFLIHIKGDWYSATLELERAQRRLATTAGRLDILVKDISEVRA